MIPSSQPLRTLCATVAAWIVLAPGCPVWAQADVKPEANAEAVRAAIEPDAPPIADASYGSAGSFSRFGPPGPYFPDRAVRLQQGGVAVLKCKEDKGGRLSGCEVLAEGPTTFGFGAAALHMASAGYLRAKTTADEATDGKDIRIVVMFPKPPRS